MTKVKNAKVNPVYTNGVDRLFKTIYEAWTPDLGVDLLVESLRDITHMAMGYQRIDGIQDAQVIVAELLDTSVENPQREKALIEALTAMNTQVHKKLKEMEDDKNKR